MTQTEVFLDNDKLVYKDKEKLYAYSVIDDKDKSQEIILNDNDAFSQYTTMNRNMTVLRNKLNSKYDYSYVFGLKDIKGSTLGFVLVSDGNGTEPYWADPTDVAWGLQDNEVVGFDEAFVFNTSVYDTTMYTMYNTKYPIANTTPQQYTTQQDLSKTRVQISSSDFIFPVNTSLRLSPFNVSRTVIYKSTMIIKPKKLQLVNGYAGIIYVKDTDVDTNYTYVARTDRGDVILKGVSTIADGINTSQIITDTVFNVIYSIYAFDVNLGTNIYSEDEQSDAQSARNYKEQIINDIMFEDEFLYIDYTQQEGDGTLLEFEVKTVKGCTIRSLQIELYTNELG
jgi:hypothetical protein